MKHLSLFRSLFNFRKKEIDAAFANAQPLASCYGIKVLKSASPAPEPGPSPLDPAVSPGKHSIEASPPAKFILIPTRGWPNAPKRNRLRRQVKAIIFEEKLHEKEPGIYIILLYPVAKDIDRAAVRKFLCEAFNR